MLTRRKEPRSMVPLMIKTVPGKGFNEALYNISPRGACFTSPAFFEKNKEVSICLTLNEKDFAAAERVALLGKIVWRMDLPEEQPQYGVEFLENGEKRKKINNFIINFQSGTAF
ncbi:MAG: PilZ domain-containing protein [bacterium]